VITAKLKVIAFVQCAISTRSLGVRRGFLLPLANAKSVLAFVCAVILHIRHMLYVYLMATKFDITIASNDWLVVGLVFYCWRCVDRGHK
jgi:hypothetical protein